MPILKDFYESYQLPHCLPHNTLMAFSSPPPAVLLLSSPNKMHSKSSALLVKRIKLLFATWCCLT